MEKLDAIKQIRCRRSTKKIVVEVGVRKSIVNDWKKACTNYHTNYNKY